jgi:O-antigen ligase
MGTGASGAAWLATVTTLGAQVVVVVRTTRRTFLTLRTGVCRAICRFLYLCLA